MKNLFKAGLILISTTLGVSACGSNVNPVTLENTSFTSLADSTTTQATNRQKQGKQGKDGHGEFKVGFGQFAGITLTAEQKTALEALRPQVAQQDKSTMKANMEAATKALKDAFLADTINRDDLKAKLTALHPAKPDDSARAENMIKAYNILTSEQKATLETKKAEMQAKAEAMKAEIDAKIGAGTAKVKPDNSAMFDKLATDLALTDAQKTSLKEALTPPVKVEADRTAEQAARKAQHDAVDSAIKAGDVAKLKELLASEKKPDMIENILDRIVKIHDILNADQRAKIVDKVPFLGFGGGHGRPQGGKGGGYDKGGKGEHIGFAMGGPRGGHMNLGQAPIVPSQNLSVDSAVQESSV